MGLGFCFEFAPLGLGHVAQGSRHDLNSGNAAASERRLEWICAGWAPDACAKIEQVYKRLGAAAWPIRALIERGFLEPARRELSRVLAQSEAVTPANSRSEAVFLLFQAAFALGPQVREELLRQLAAMFAADPFWRQLRNLADALAMLRTEDPDLAARTVAALPPGPQSAKLARRLASAEAAAPRPFFW